MSRLAIPLDHYVLWSTGDLILRAEMDLLLKDAQGHWHPQSFRVNSATDMTTLPAYDAKQRLNLPMPVKASPLKHTQTGLEVRSGTVCLNRARTDLWERRSVSSGATRPWHLCPTASGQNG